MSGQPLVSVAAINYNNSKYLLEALNSIKLQTYSNVELIIVDDKSTDNSLDIIVEWMKTYEGNIKTIFHKVNQGFYAGFNNAISASTGKYFVFLATDDVMLEYKISNQVSVIENYDDVAMVYGDCMVIDENSKTLETSTFNKIKGISFTPPSGNIFKEVVDDFFFYTQASIFNLNLLRKSGFKFDSKILSEDWDVELALSRQYKILGSTEVCIKYRRTSTSITALNWNVDRIHKVYESHFYMFSKYVNNSLNDKRDNEAIINKMRYYYWELYKNNKINYRKKITFFYKIFKNSLKFIDFVTFVKIVLKIRPNI